MAAGLGFKDFTTGEVLTAADVDGYLMQGVWVFASAAARTSAVASPQEGNMSFLKDTNSLEYYSGAAWVAVAGGGGGGKVLQVINATYSTETSSSSSAFADTGLTASITPSSATSKVLVFAAISGIYKNTTDTGGEFKLLRGATNLIQFGTAQSNSGSSTRSDVNPTLQINYLDTPATTSATTYKVQFASTGNSAALVIQVGNNNASSIVLMEIGA
jgi:hypothetical protein